MVKQTQTNCLSVFDHFVKLALKFVKEAPSKVLILNKVQPTKVQRTKIYVKAFDVKLNLKGA